MSTTPLVTVIVNGHREGWIAHKSIRNLVWCVEHARRSGITVEIIAILDSPDARTEQVFRHFEDFFDTIEIIAARDLSRARNAGIKRAQGEYVALLDADDVWDKDWLPACVAFFRNASHQKMVLHPEYSIYFDAKNTCWKHEDSTQMDADGFGRLLVANPWTSLVFALRETFLKHPYADTTLGSGFGYEDWHWNCDILAAGYDHRVVPGTVHLIRQKQQGSLLNNQRASTLTLRASPFFEQIDRLTPKLGAILSAFVAKKKQVKSALCASIPNHVLDIMRNLSCFDDRIYPASHRLKNMVHYTLEPNHAGRIYGELRRCFGTAPIDIVFVVPWLKRGGADLAILLHVEAVLRVKPDARIIVVATENDSSLWASQLPPNVGFFELGRLCGTNETHFLPQILLRLLIQTAPRAVHIIQSNAGWKLVRDHGAALKHATRLYASVYLDGRSEEGEIFAYARTYLADCLDYLSAVFCDNQAYIDLLVEEYGFPHESFVTLYHPLRHALPSPADKTVAAVTGTPRILWASRIDRQKRPDILFAIARQCPHITFDMYGEAADSAYVCMIMRDKPVNVVLHGAYDHFSDIDISLYATFLYTTESDGMPNILLEVGNTGLPILAPAVGGIPELITMQTGFLIPDTENVPAYCAALEQCLANPDATHAKADACRALIAERHTWARFTQIATGDRGYGFDVAALRMVS